MCCGEATMIFSGTSADGKPIHSVACLLCGRHELSRDRDIAVQKFKEGVEECKKQ